MSVPMPGHEDDGDVEQSARQTGGAPPMSGGEGDTAPVDPGVDARLAQHWARVRGRLRSEIGESAFRSWLKPLTLVAHRDGVVRLGVPTRFMRDWISGN
jgi:hypothetical protein